MTSMEMSALFERATWDDVIDVIGYLAACVVACTPLASMALRSARWLHARALETKSKADDAITARLVTYTERAVATLELLSAYLPRLTNDVREARRVIGGARRIFARERKVPPLLTLVLAITLAQGCGASQMERARTVLSISGQALVATEHAFVPQYEAAGARARAQSASYESYADAMRRWNAAADAIALASAALRTAEVSLDVIERDGVGDVRDVVACVSESLIDALEALSALVSVPRGLVATIHVAHELAGGTCTSDAERPRSTP